VYTSFPSADSVIVRDLFGVEDVLEGSTFGASAECTPREHPYANSYRYPDINKTVHSRFTYCDGHKLVKVQDGLIDRVAAGP
jgi:hypothetical protein